jgi:putative acetyltransferase
VPNLPKLTAESGKWDEFVKKKQHYQIPDFQNIKKR